MMNFTTMLCKHLSVKELVTNVPVYPSISGNACFLPGHCFFCLYHLSLDLCAMVLWCHYDYGLDGASGGLSLMFRRWATKKQAGSTKNGRDSKPKNLGVKKFGGERVIPGNIIVRQRGTRFHPGDYVGMGKDHTLYALKEGNVKFETNKLTGRKWVHVEPKYGYELHPIYTKVSGDSTQVTTAS
ncbi:hypothetical protein DKX38_003735 [Salix brachista]|uniref:50S ribosomal protein L27 n=1 Tax=Salix brachista TaxID=2182728 RepID=A0A5N5NB48_9ROSI|nr:hypothetical protein DKX38_003735 [Salix brachista]